MEQWKLISDTDNRYSISSLGNIKNNNTNRILKDRIDRNGYHSIFIKVNNILKNLSIHRLVAIAFIPQLNNDRCCINHKDLNKDNNNYLNLEWCTYKENTKHYVTNTNIENLAWKFVPIISINLKTLECIKYESIKGAAKIFKVNKNAIKGVLKGKTKRMYYYRFLYEEIPELL
jgi:hypothetical protein